MLPVINIKPIYHSSRAHLRGALIPLRGAHYCQKYTHTVLAVPPMILCPSPYVPVQTPRLLAGEPV